MRSVVAAATAAPMSGSSDIRPRPIESKNQTLSKPFASAARAPSETTSPPGCKPAGCAPKSMGSTMPSLIVPLLLACARRYGSGSHSLTSLPLPSMLNEPPSCEATDQSIAGLLATIGRPSSASISSITGSGFSTAPWK